jgi:hypothetical protein
LNTSATILLALAGALGGLAQALLAEKGRVRIPTWDATARQLDLGFVADLVIGTIGALAALVVALAVLNQQFFATTVATPGSVGGAPLDIPSWIRFTSFGALAGFGSRRLLPALSEKITDAIVGEVAKQVESSEKRLMQQTETTAEVLQTSIAGVTTAAHMKLAGAAAPGVSSLEVLVKEYDEINEADYSKRLALKNQVASRMSAFLLQSGDQRDHIVSRIQAGGSEAWVLALVLAIVANSQLGDGTLLLNVAHNLRKLHVQYHVVNAFYALKLRRLLSGSEESAAVALINGYLSGADTSLRRKIETAVAYLKSGT